jgi:hypothetical protein
VRWPLVFRSRHERTRALYEQQVEKTRDAEKDRAASVSASARTARRYTALARVVAVHIVSAETNGVDIHPSVLRAAIERARIDLSIEFDRASRDGATS